MVWRKVGRSKLTYQQPNEIAKSCRTAEYVKIKKTQRAVRQDDEFSYVVMIFQKKRTRPTCPSPKSKISWTKQCLSLFTAVVASLWSREV